MEQDGLNCPAEDCSENRDGHCGIKQVLPIGLAAAAFYPPWQAGTMAPFGPAGLAITGAMADGQPLMDTFGLWHNCPRLKAKEEQQRE